MKNPQNKIDITFAKASVEIPSANALLPAMPKH
jgi:hypothetical protein